MKRIFTHSRLAGIISCFMLLGILMLALPKECMADSEHPILSLSINGTNIDEFKIIHLDTTAETELRPTVKGADGS